MSIKSYNHVQLSKVDSKGNQDIMWPENTTKDILLKSQNENLPAGSTTLYDLEDKFGILAFMNNVCMENLDDNLQNTIKTLVQNVSDLMYKAISITSFTNNTNILPKGSSISTVVFNWATNKKPTALNFRGGGINEAIDVGLTSKTFTFPTSITQTTSFTLKATDERNATMEKTTSIVFANYIYYGVASTTESVDETKLSSVLSESKSRTISVNSGEGQYVYYLLPTRLGTPTFVVGGFEGGFIKIGSSVDKTNSAGYTEPYDIWRSVNEGLGSLSITVK